MAVNRGRYMNSSVSKQQPSLLMWLAWIVLEMPQVYHFFLI